MAGLCTNAELAPSPILASITSPAICAPVSDSATLLETSEEAGTHIERETKKEKNNIFPLSSLVAEWKLKCEIIDTQEKPYHCTICDKRFARA
jgi:hypothetical protein